MLCLELLGLGQFSDTMQKIAPVFSNKVVAFMNFLMCFSEKQLLAVSLVLCNDIKADYTQPFSLAAEPEPLHP